MRIPDTEAMRKAALVHDYERNNHCTDEWHAHWLGLTYTDGIKFLADTCGAYWLIDAVASHQPDVTKVLNKHRLGGFQVWRLRKAGDVWTLDAWSDIPEAPESESGPASVKLAEQEIGFSDFPESLSPFEFWVEGSTALLKCEH